MKQSLIHNVFLDLISIGIKWATVAYIAFFNQKSGVKWIQSQKFMYKPVGHQLLFILKRIPGAYTKKQYKIR